MRHKEHLDDQKDELDDSQVDVERLFEPRDEGVEFEELEQPDQPEDAQATEDGEVGRVGVRRQNELDDLDGQRGGRVDPEPAGEILDADGITISGVLPLVQEGEAEREGEVEEEEEGHAHLEVPKRPLGIGGKAHAHGDCDGAVHDECHNDEVPLLLPRGGGVDDREERVAEARAARLASAEDGGRHRGLSHHPARRQARWLRRVERRK